MSSNVGENLTLPTHDISLSDGENTFGFMLENGVQSFVERSQTPSTILNRGGANKWGDYDPMNAQVEQRTFIGGRGSKDFSGDQTQFWDSKNAFTMLDGKVCPAPQWKIASGLTRQHNNLPGDVNWQPLISATRYAASAFTVGSATIAADDLNLWIRRVGSPGTLTAQIWTDSTGPNTLVASATNTVTTTTITDYVSEFYKFDLSAAANLNATTTYWVVVFGASTDNKTNHWEVGVDNTTTSSEVSSDASSWTTATFSLYFRVSTTSARSFIFFEMYGVLFAVAKNVAGTVSYLYMNGEIGVATGGTATTLVDTNEGEDGSWANDQWNGWYVKGISGTCKGEVGLITDTTDAGTLTISGFNKTPAVGDVYVIYGGDAWKTYTNATTGLGVVKDVAVLNNIAYFAQGSSDNIRRITYVAGSHAFAYADDSTNKADKLHTFDDPVDGPIIWRGENDTVDVSRAKAAAWGTDLVFGTEIKIGSTTQDIINMIDYDKKLWVFKANGVYVINSDRAEKLNVGLDFIKSSNNGAAAIAHKLFMIFSWGGFTVQRYYGADLSSIGYERNYGLPSNRKGSAVAMHSHPAGLFVAVDGGDSNYSSILVREELFQGWHEIFRSPVAGWRVRSMYWQDCPGTKPRLWIECGGDLFYQEWPQDTFNPLEDDINFQHEAVVELADIDMGASRLPKAISELNLISEQLTDGIEAFLDYRIDDETTWTPAGRFTISPHQVVAINESEVRKIGLRLRMLTNDASVPPIVLATVLEGVLRTPFKRQWTFRCKAGDFQVSKIGVPDASPSDLLKFLYNAASRARYVNMRTRFPEADDITVMVDPPTVQRTSVISEIGNWSGTFEFTVRER